MSLNLYYFYCNFVQFIAWFVFPKHFFFFKYKEIRVAKIH